MNFDNPQKPRNASPTDYDKALSYDETGVFMRQIKELRELNAAQQRQLNINQVLIVSLREEIQMLQAVSGRS